MKIFSNLLMLFAAPLFFTSCQNINDGKAAALETSGISLWLTTPDKTSLLEKQPVNNIDPIKDAPVIKVNTSQTFQRMDGFGYTLTGGSALHIHKMDPPNRHALLKELFGQGPGAIGVSYLRVSIGASDLNEKPFSYNDLAPGEVDPYMKKFTLAPDKVHLIPVLKEILSIYPDLKILGSPWSPPAWMKTNNDTRGGSLKPEYYDAYALYFVKYIQGMAAEGIPIDAITVQNEPLHPGNNPSLLMHAVDQAIFIKDHLGPAFEKAGLQTKIIIYDHNADRPDYPISIMDDPEAKKYINGSAFHLYGGEIEALSRVHEAHPDKHIYFTEQWIGAPGDFPNDLAWHISELIIGAPRNWSRVVLEWNLAADANQDPHTNRGGCDRCLGALTIEGNEVVRNPAYYIIAHASKFVRPGSLRVGSNEPEHLTNVAYETPDSEIVIIVHNQSDTLKRFKLEVDGENLTTQLPSGAVGTYVMTKNTSGAAGRFLQIQQSK